MLCNQCMATLTPDEAGRPYCAKCIARPFARWLVNGLVLLLLIACLAIGVLTFAHA
jgi:hypothetical protein